MTSGRKPASRPPPPPRPSPAESGLDKSAALPLALAGLAMPAIGAAFTGLSAYDTYKNVKAMREAKRRGDVEAARRNRNWALFNALMTGVSIPFVGTPAMLARIGRTALMLKGGKNAAKMAESVARVPAASRWGAEKSMFGKGRAGAASKGLSNVLGKLVVDPYRNLESRVFKGLARLPGAGKLEGVERWADAGKTLPARLVRGASKFQDNWKLSLPLYMGAGLGAPYVIGENPVWAGDHPMGPEGLVRNNPVYAMPPANNPVFMGKESGESGRLGVDLAAALLGSGAGLAGNYLAGADSPWLSAGAGAAAGLAAAEGGRALGEWLSSPYEEPRPEVPPGEFVPESQIRMSDEFLQRLKELAEPPDPYEAHSPLLPPAVVNQIGAPGAEGVPMTPRGAILADAIRSGAINMPWR